MTMNRYARAIEIVTDPDTNFRAIVIEIAKKHPEYVVEAVGTAPWLQEVDDYIRDVVEAVGTAPWLQEVDDYIRDGDNVKAVKVWREYTGDGLKDAVKAVRARQAERGL
jgi:hypothetical protein